MPLTPFHFGPGIFAKSVIRSHFSLAIFIIIQIIIDLETLWNILAGYNKWHTFLHTYLGATFLTVLCVLAERITPILRKRFSSQVVLCSVAFGAYSHVFLDSIMHADLNSLAPLSMKSFGLNLVSIETLHLFCLLSGALGGIIFLARWFLKRYPRRYFAKKMP